MTCKPILVFLEENGIAPTRENKKRWQAGWTMTELQQGYQSILDEYDNAIKKEFWENFIEEKEKQKQKINEAKIQKVIEKEKIRREKFEQFTFLETGIDYKRQLFILNFFTNEK